MSSSYRSSRLGLSHWDPYAMHRGGCLELCYCNMVEWFLWDSSLTYKTNWFPSVLWHCWFGQMTCKNRLRYVFGETLHLAQSTSQQILATPLWRMIPFPTYLDARRCLRSASSQSLIVGRVRMSTIGRPSSFSGRRSSRSCLSQLVTFATSPSVLFRSRLKTHCHHFRCCFSWLRADSYLNFICTIISIAIDYFFVKVTNLRAFELRLR